MEDSCVLIGEALILRNNVVEKLFVHGQVGQGCQKPTVSEFTLEIKISMLD
jgi:hypothetical protein